MSELGVEPGDRVLIAAPDGVEFVWAFLGAVRLGAVAVPVNPRLTVDDHRFLAGDAGARIVVTTADLADRFADSAVVVEIEVLAARLDGRPAVRPAAVEPSAPAYAQYTSGTTGAPKAALHRHSDPLVYFRAFAEGAIRIRPDDVMLSVSKMFFAYGLGNSLFFTLLAGCRAVLHAGAPRPADIAALARGHRATVLYSVPTFYAHLIADGQRDAFTSLRVAVSAGEALVPSLLHRARNFLGCPMLDGLGSTEVGQTFVSNTLEASRDGTIGRQLPPYEVAVRDDDRGDVPPDTIGLLWVRGPTVLIEYLGRPEATAAVKEGDWLCTGDRAVIDTDGFVAHRGRADDIEIVGGVNVAPMEIEEVLSAHPAVTEGAVAGVRNTAGASRLEAFVVVRPGAPADDALAAELTALARQHLAPHKVPRVVHFVSGLPRTPTGKLRRFVLRAGGASAESGNR